LVQAASLDQLAARVEVTYGGTMAAAPNASPRPANPTEGERLEPVRDEDGASNERWNEQEAVRAAAHRELNREVLLPAVARLGGITGIATLILVTYLVLGWLIGAHALGVAGSLRERTPSWLVAAIVVSAATYAATRVRRLAPSLLYDAGHLYLVILSLLLGFGHHTKLVASDEILLRVSPVILPILVFGALVPASPRTALTVLVAAASMDPLAMYLTHAHDLPGARDILLMLVSPLVAVLVGYRISRVVHRLNEGIVKAREIGSYRLIERLGVGGMAEVWRADHHMLARTAAVKLIRSQVLSEHGPPDAQRLLKLFVREARTTASLSSPHTVQIYDFGTTREGSFYYVMELLDGSDLKTLVERRGPLPAERVAHLMRQACHSLNEAHERSFVHRDIKPANIFACRYGGEYDFVKVVDFGLVLDRHPTAEELEDEQRFVGTPAVMAPEMVRFQAPVDARADIYALGCVGYWLLTGKRVFEADTRHDMLVMHAHQKPLRPSRRVGSELHVGLEDLIMACLEKNPDRRPQTARKLGDDLAALSFDQPWTQERARGWWETLPPTSLQAD
jgi:serine/threonine-protein kinase